MQRNFIEYPGQRQEAFVVAAVKAVGRPTRTATVTKLIDRVIRVADKVRFKREPGWNAKLGFKTAQVLRGKGFIE